jgi:hypothetical protein
MTSLRRDIGTIEWCRRTNGILGRGERARFTAATVLRTARLLPALLRSRRTPGRSGPDPSELTPPDSALAREIVDACSDLEPMVVEHGYRSYLFARALGAVEGLECDDEALFAATMLHDYGFKDIDAIQGRCFTLVGADVAAELLERSLSRELVHDVQDAITLHLNPAVPPEQGPLQHLVHDGILLDVLGARAWELHRAGIERVHARHPRHAFTVRGRPLLEGHARRVPHCRSAALFAAGFGPALKQSPWHAADAAPELAAA